MAPRRTDDWRHGRRFLVGLVVIYAILVQALASPALQARMLADTGIARALAFHCLPGEGPDGSDPDNRPSSHLQCLDCCLPGGRFLTLDLPVLATSIIRFEPAARQVRLARYFTLPQGRAPPAALTCALQPRAPPVFLA
jgi:hypothetical protein